jgi:hypothetical protein
MASSIAVMLYVYFGTKIAWTWYGVIGSSVTFLVAWAVSYAFAPAPKERRDELAPGGAVEELLPEGKA